MTEQQTSKASKGSNPSFSIVFLVLATAILLSSIGQAAAMKIGLMGAPAVNPVNLDIDVPMRRPSLPVAIEADPAAFALRPYVRTLTVRGHQFELRRIDPKTEEE